MAVHLPDGRSETQVSFTYLSYKFCHDNQPILSRPGTKAQLAQSDPHLCLPGSFATPAVESCFTSVVGGSDQLTLDVFMEWIKREPQTFVWLPTMHRLAAAEDVRHDAKCNSCKMYPIIGFRSPQLIHLLT